MYRVAAALVPLLWLSTAQALDEPKDKADKPAKTESVAEQIKDLQTEMQKSRSDILAKLRKAETDEEKSTLSRQYSGVGPKYARKFLDLATENPKDPAASQALAMVLSSGPNTPAATKAVEMIIKDQRYDDSIIAVLPVLTSNAGRQAEELLRGAAEHAKSDDGRGKATFALAQFVKRRAETGGRDAKTLNAEAEKLFETVVDKYADVKVFNRPIGPQAKGELFEMRHLSIGKTVPEIETEDIDGTKFKLSDYRGKVVLLDFWGNW